MEKFLPWLRSRVSGIIKKAVRPSISCNEINEKTTEAANFSIVCEVDYERAFGRGRVWGLGNNLLSPMKPLEILSSTSLTAAPLSRFTGLQ